MFSRLISLTGNYSIISVDFSPPIQLPKRQCYIALLSFNCYNAIANLKNKKFYIDPESGDNSPAVSKDIPTGNYEIGDIEDTVRSLFPDINFSLKPNHNTLKCVMKADKEINFYPKDSIANILGFDNKIYEAGVEHTSNFNVDINPVTCIRISCNIATGSYINDDSAHIISQSSIKADPGYEIINEALHPLYLPITEDSVISNLTIRVEDQNSELIDFRGEKISILLHLRE